MSAAFIIDTRYKEVLCCAISLELPLCDKSFYFLYDSMRFNVLSKIGRSPLKLEYNSML